MRDAVRRRDGVDVEDPRRTSFARKRSVSSTDETAASASANRVPAASRVQIPLRVATPRYQAALLFGIRRWVG